MKRQVLTIDARMLFSSGIGTYLQNLLKRLRFESLGVSVEIYVRNEDAAVWMRQYQPAAIVKLCPYWIYGPREQLFWLKNLKGGAFWSPHFNIPWYGHEKLIVTVHDAFPLTPLAHPLMKIYAAFMYARIRATADAIMTVSDFSRQELILRAGLSDIPISVIHNGVAPSWFTATPSESPYAFNYFVYVGNLKPHKNLYRLLKAFEKINPKQKLVCVGPFKNLRARDNRAKTLMEKLGDRVLSTDTITDEQLHMVVKHSDGLILPSLYEGFGLPPLEAMAAKVPVLVNKAAALPEVCGPSALYCDARTVEGMSRGLQELIELKGAERERRIKEGCDHAAQFNWDTAAQAAFEVFRSVLG